MRLLSAIMIPAKKVTTPKIRAARIHGASVAPGHEIVMV
jgi:hypothetical protein